MSKLAIGHRGCKAYEPENTLLSIKKAIELGVDAVEIDVHLTKDKEIVVIHDDKVDRTTNGKGYVKDFTFKEIRKLDAGKGQKIPTLQEVIDLTKGKVMLSIELKGLGTAKPVLDLVKENKIEDKVIIKSFWHGMVKEIRKYDKKIKTGILFVGNPVNPSKLAKDAKANALVVNYKFVNKKMVDDAHKNNLKVFVWNIDDKDEIEEIDKLGVDGIGSNKPDIIVDYYERNN